MRANTKILRAAIDSINHSSVIEDALYYAYDAMVELRCHELIGLTHDEVWTTFLEGQEWEIRKLSDDLWGALDIGDEQLAKEIYTQILLEVECAG